MDLINSRLGDPILDSISDAQSKIFKTVKLGSNWKLWLDSL